MPHEKLPMQPLLIVDGVIRFRKNAVVDTLLRISQGRGFGLNELCMLDLPDEDWEQFAQLIGYSVSGFGDLSYASPETVQKTDNLAAQLLKETQP